MKKIKCETKTRNLNKSSKQKSKRSSIISWILLFAFIFTSIPLEVFADTKTISITGITYNQVVREGRIVGSVLQIRGSNLVGVKDISISGAEGIFLSSKDMGARLSEPNNSLITLTANTNNLEYNQLNFNQTGTSEILFDVQDGYLMNNMPDNSLVVEIKIPSILPLKNKLWYIDEILENPQLILEGEYFDFDDEITIARAKLTPTNDFVEISADKKKARIIRIPGNAVLNDKNIVVSRKGVSTVPTNISVRFENYIEVTNKLREFENPQVRPSVGGYNRENRIDIVSLDENRIPKEVITEDLSVFLIKSGEDSSIIANRIPTTRIKEIPANKKELKVSTSKMQGTLEQKYDILIERSDGASVLIPNSYTLIPGLNQLKVTDVIEREVRNTQEGDKDTWESILIQGQNLISIDKLALGISNDGTITPKKNIGTSNILQNPNRLLIEYDLNTVGLKPKFLNQEIKEIKREIIVKIGPSLEPKELQEISNEITNDKTKHYYTQVGDGVVFLPPEKIETGNQLVEVETNTIIKYGDSNSIVTLPDKYVWENEFTYREFPLEPVINAVEPSYGYYYDGDKPEPLMVRLNGSNFKVIQNLDGTKSFPKIEFFDISGAQEDKIHEINITPKKILDSNGNTVNIINGEGVGNIYIFEVNPTDIKLRDRILNYNNPKDGYIQLPVRIDITNPDNGKTRFNLDGKKFHFRHPDTKDENVLLGIQPIIEGLYIAGGGKTTEFNSNIENEILVKFRMPNGNINDVVITIDGKIIDVPRNTTYRYSEQESGLRVIKLKTPKGISGDTRLQLIVNEGLMHSEKIKFSVANGPWLKSIAPVDGQEGTWTIIKRDELVNSISFQEGTKVLINDVVIDSSNYIIRDGNTIELRIPDGIGLGPQMIRVEGSTSSVRSNSIIFNVLDIGNSRVELDSIIPNIGNVSGGSPATIKSKAGFKFDKVDAPYKVYFGDKISPDVKISIDGTALYAIVPPFTDYEVEPPNQVTVPVTVQNNKGATDTIMVSDGGYTYSNPTYQNQGRMTIDKIYKKDSDTKTNVGMVGEFFVIEGTNFRVKAIPGSKEIKKEDLPYVFFGYEEAMVIEPILLPTEAKSDIEFLPKLVVRVPKKSENASANGEVDVIVINKTDGGTAKKEKGFKYGRMNPQIIKEGSYLRASRFGETIPIKTKEVYKDGLIVAFGNEEKSGILDTQNKAKVELDNPIGDIVVEYEYKSSGNTAKIFYKNPDGTLELMKDTKGTSDGEFLLNEFNTEKLIAIDWTNVDYHKKDPRILQQPDIVSRLNDELVLVKLDLENDKLIVRRALGKIEKFTDSGNSNALILVNTPFHTAKPDSTIEFINANGSRTEPPTAFEFHSGLNFPEITDIKGSKEVTEKIDGVDTKVKVYTHDVTADATIELIGKNFKDVNKVRVGDKEVTFKINDNNYTSLVLNVPKGESSDVGKLQNVVVETKEGIALSQKSVPPVFFKYIFTGSKPVIETIEPTVGPRTGNTKVRITGKDFRELDEYGTGSTGEAKKTLIKVSINGTPSVIDSLEYDDKKELIGLTIFTPQSVTGKAKLQVINADGGTSEPKDFTYISQPEISQTEGSIFFNDTESEVKLFGVDFQSGAKVVIGAEQTLGKKPTDTKISGMVGVTPEGINQEGHLVGGVEATGVKVTGTNQITFKMPEGIESLDNVDIIIVNPDTGMSKPKPGNIKPPVPDVPDIEAIPGFERTMLLRWKVDKDVLNAAEKFEIYVRERRSGDYTFVGDTKQDTTEQSYVIKGLKYDTTYDILVRVLNKYGEAEDFASVRETTLKQNQDYKEKEKLEAVDKAVTQIETQGKQEVIGDTLYYTVGTRESTINLSNTTAKNKTKYVQIPVRDIKAGNKTITITDKDLSLTVSYSSLNTPELRNAPDDAVFRFKISAAEKQVEEGLTRAIPRVYKKASNVYGIYFELAQPKLVTPIAMLSGSATININAPAFPKYHAVYIESADAFSILQSNIITQGGNYVLLTNK